MQPLFRCQVLTPLDLSCSGALRLKTKFGPQPKQARAVWHRVWQISAKYVQMMANAFDTFYALCIMLSNVQHVFLSFLSHFVAGFRYSHWHFMYSRAGYNFSSSVIIWSQAKSEQLYSMSKLQPVQFVRGKKWTTSGKRACIIGPKRTVKWSERFVFLVHTRPWFLLCWCLFHRYKIMIVDGWGDLSILENPYIQVGSGWCLMVIVCA